jgi:large subunit ribosomal protein L16
MATRSNTVEFGEFGLQTLDAGWIRAQCIEAGRIVASQFVRGTGRLYIRIFPHKPITSRPPETRMGKGKGEPAFWSAVVKPGTILYEISGIPEDTARACLSRVADKMPVRCRLVKRRPIL